MADISGGMLMKMAVRTLRRLLDAFLLALVCVVVALVIASIAGPRLGHQPIVIRGGSMSPAIPLGSLVDVAQVKPGDIAVGDVVTVKGANGVYVTHRVIGIVNQGGVVQLKLQGDANAAPDPTLVPASSVVGRVDLSLPLAGYLLYLLTLPSGMASVVAFGLTLLLATWLIEDVERELYRKPRNVPALVLGKPVGVVRLDDSGEPSRRTRSDEWIG